MAERFAGPPVREEFRPTLPELLGPRLRRMGRWGAALVAVAGVVLVLLLVVLAGGGQDAGRVVVVRGPVAFNLAYDPTRLDRVAPAAGDALRLQSPASTPAPASVTVRPITLPAYTGDPAGVEPLVASTLIARMRRADRQFILRSEGRTRINQQPGYQIQFQTADGGRTVYGRRTLLFADQPGVRQGADITLLAARSPTVPNVDAVGSNGPTKLPYRSFRLGTERP